MNPAQHITCPQFITAFIRKKEKACTITIAATHRLHERLFFLFLFIIIKKEPAQPGNVRPARTDWKKIENVLTNNQKTLVNHFSRHAAGNFVSIIGHLLQSLISSMWYIQ